MSNAVPLVAVKLTPVGRAQTVLPLDASADASRVGDRVVVQTDAGTGHFEELAQLSGARLVGYKAHVMLMGGFPYVVEAVGAPQSVT